MAIQWNGADYTAFSVNGVDYPNVVWDGVTVLGDSAPPSLPIPIVQLEFEDDITDSTGNITPTMFTGVITYEAGVIGQQAVFDGASAIELTATPSYPFTIAMYFTMPSDTGTNMLTALPVPPVNLVAAIFAQAGVITCSVNSSSDNSVSTTALTAGQSYLVIAQITSDAEKAALYIDNVEATEPGIDYWNTDTSLIGGVDLGGVLNNQYMGSIDMYEVYDYLLTAEERTALFDRVAITNI